MDAARHLGPHRSSASQGAVTSMCKRRRSPHLDVAYRWSAHRPPATSTSGLETAFQQWRADHDMGHVLRVWQREVVIMHGKPLLHADFEPLQDPVKSNWARMGHRLGINPVLRRRTTSTSPQTVSESESPPRHMASASPPRGEGGLCDAFRLWRTEKELGSVLRLWHQEDPVTAGAKSNWSRMGRKISVNPIIRRRATGGRAASVTGSPSEEGLMQWRDEQGLVAMLRAWQAQDPTSKRWISLGDRLRLGAPLLRKAGRCACATVPTQPTSHITARQAFHSWRECRSLARSQARRRKWFHVDGTGTGRKSGKGMRVLQYNILADAYARAAWLPYCKPASLNWEYRKHNLLGEILGYNADLICLQEVDHFGDFFLPELRKRGYDGAFVKRPSQFKKDGCCIFYRRDKFKLREKFEIQFNDLVRRGGPRFHTNNVAVLLSLAISERAWAGAGGSVTVGCAHLFHDPSQADIKVLQSQMLMQAILRTARTRTESLILCGDFNSQPGDLVYNLIQDGVAPERLEEELGGSGWGKSLMSGRLPLSNAYVVGMGENLEVTNFTDSFQGCLDYIWMTPGAFDVVRVLEGIDRSHLEEEAAN